MAPSALKVSIVIVIGLVFAQQVTAQPRDFLRKVSIREVEADLQSTLAIVLGSSSATATRRLQAIETSTWQTFQALPKNSAGRLAPAAVRYMVHGYFAKEHGWLVKGLEPHGMQVNVSQVHDVSILQDKAPLLVEGLLEARQSDRGLALDDVVAMIAILEQLVYDESVTLLEAAYRLNELPVGAEIDQAKLLKVLWSYQILLSMGSNANLFDVEGHKLLRSRQDIEGFALGTVLNFEFERRHRVNPFKPVRYSFEVAAEIMTLLAHQHGKWQNEECRDMKAALAERDPAGLGAVPLGNFYAPSQASAYSFDESVDYLRSIGALDESTPGSPKVFIANYINGASNCLATSAYYSVCCISECEHVMTDLEHYFAAPAASPEKVLDFIDRHTDEILPLELPKKLHAIAERHGGEVPLHGRLFAQWLHFALPQECPYPSVIQSATALTASQWLDTVQIASEEEKQQHKASSSALSFTDIDVEGRWSDHEFLPVVTPPSQPLISTGTIRAVVQLVAMVAVLRSALVAWRSMGSVQAGGKKDDDFAMHV
jgi:hypothetical protein